MICGDDRLRQAMLGPVLLCAWREAATARAVWRGPVGCIGAPASAQLTRRAGVAFSRNSHHRPAVHGSSAEFLSKIFIA